MRINKIKVLNQAKLVGLNIPKTLITNRKDELKKFKEEIKEIVVKPISEIINFTNDDELFLMRTSLIRNNDIDKLENNFQTSLFQQYIDKEFEIRVFFIENQFYPMAIFSQTSDKTKIDFRNYDDVNPNRTVRYNLPVKIQEMLIQLMNMLNLNTGSIDLIKATNGKYYFLEVNPVGQFGMVSHPCNYNLEKTIANTFKNEIKTTSTIR